MVMRFDPFRDVDRLTQQLRSMTTSSATLMAMDAYRRGEAVFVHFDLPGVDPGSIEVTAERNTLTVNAERRWNEREGDQIIARERPEGRFSRQLMLGENLDVDAIDARYEDGVLTLEIPVAEAAKPRRVEIRGPQRESAAIDVETTDT
jgi:HSP20 family protein